MAEGVTAVNQAVDANDEKLLMAALTYPRVSIYGVTSQCSKQYLEELTKLKDAKKQPGWCYLSLWAKESDRIFTTESTVQEVQIVTSPRKNVLQNIQ